MKIKSHILLLQTVVVGTVLMMAGVAFTSQHYGNLFRKRVEASNHQLAAISSVALHANDFSEQIAELLLVGGSQKSDYKRAATDLEKAFVRLEHSTLDERHFLLGADQPGGVQHELYRLARMRELYAEMDKVVQSLVALRESGRFDDAVALYVHDIENRLDDEFEHLLRAAVLDEQNEVQHAERQADVLWMRLSWAIAVVSLLTLAICLVTTYRVSRALLRPVHRLIGGTEAIRSGDLGARIDELRDDELGMLAKNFNRMAEQLEHQRDLVQHAQVDLEFQVADRTRKLADANHRLSELDRVRVQFFADISHELRTPLTALRGEAEITLRRPPDSTEIYRDVLNRILNLACDIGRQVDDLLFIARNETETLHFELARVCLQDIVGQIRTEGAALGRSKQITLGVRVPEQPIYILADRQRLTRALMIVVDNAVKYSSSRRVVGLQVEADNDVARVVVCDQGYGIQADDLPNVFDRSYRGRSGVGAGLGIGLAIAKRTFEKHGAEIEIVSEAGQYTEVRISIPRLKEDRGGEDSAGRG
jgi:signal transduction histidine kinase